MYIKFQKMQNTATESRSVIAWGTRWGTRKHLWVMDMFIDIFMGEVFKLNFVKYIQFIVHQCYLNNDEGKKNLSGKGREGTS